MSTMGMASENPVRSEVAARSAFPAISVIIPMRNEARNIVGCLESLINQDYPQELIEIIVVDGGSHDGSIGIVKEFVDKHANVKLLGGPGVNCPAAMNVGIRIAKGLITAKVDAHGYLAPDYLRMSVKHISKDREIKCVGGPIRPVARTRVEKANALARSSMFGVGKGIYSVGEEPQYVETVQCGVYMRDVFEEVGLFDESLQFGEDEEINWRIRRKGYKIFITPEIRFFYFPRNSFGMLFKQYYHYGLARVKVIQKHGDFFRIKHVIPAIFVLTLLSTGLLGIFSNFFRWLFVGCGATYIAVCLAFSAVISSKHGWDSMCQLPISFAALHCGYGTGFAKGVARLYSITRLWKCRNRC